MGLLKTKSTKYGVDASYHRIIQLNMNYDRLDAVVTLATYTNKDDRDAGANPIDQFQVDLSTEFHDDIYSNGEDVMKNVSLKEAYKALDRMAKAEALKTEDKNEELAFYSDAVEV